MVLHYQDLAWHVPRNTHTWLVEGYLNQDLVPLRNQILGRYSNFIRKLLNSPSKEIIFMINLVLRDARSNTCANILHLNRLTNVDCLKTAAARVKSLLPVLNVPDTEQYRIGLLNFLLETFINRTYNYVNMTKTACTEMINSLCNS